MTLLGITPPGGTELIVILVILVLLFGAKKLPELGGAVGKSIKNFKKGVEEGQEEDSEAAGEVEEDSASPASREDS